MTPFNSKYLPRRKQYVRGNTIKGTHDGKEYAAHHCMHLFAHIDFNKSLGRVIEDFYKELELSYFLETNERDKIVNLSPRAVQCVDKYELDKIDWGKTGVYFLLNHNTITYVGKSDVCIKRRISRHIGVKKFNRAFFLEIPTYFEPLFIATLTPTHNIQSRYSGNANAYKSVIVETLNKVLGFEVDFFDQNLIRNNGLRWVKIPCFGDKYIRMLLNV